MNKDFYKEKLNKLMKLFSSELSEVLELPKTENKIEEVKQEIEKVEVEKVEEKQEEVKQEVEEKQEEVKAEDEPTEETPKESSEEDDLKNVVADLQSRLTQVEATLAEMMKVNSEMKSNQEKMSSVIEILKEIPTGEEPKKTDSAFNRMAQQKSKSIDKLKELNKYFS